MKTVLIDGKEYKLEYSFEASRQTDFVSKVFKILSGITVGEGGISNGISNMVGMMPDLCVISFHAGLLENNPVDEKTAFSLMKTYMKDHKLNFFGLWEEVKALMEEDDFLSLTGIMEMLEQMQKETLAVAESLEDTEKKPNKKKSTTTK